jgi:hypothetical protein
MDWNADSSINCEKKNVDLEHLNYILKLFGDAF